MRSILEEEWTDGIFYSREESGDGDREALIPTVKNLKPTLAHQMYYLSNTYDIYNLE